MSALAPVVTFPALAACEMHHYVCSTDNAENIFERSCSRDNNIVARVEHVFTMCGRVRKLRPIGEFDYALRYTYAGVTAKMEIRLRRRPVLPRGITTREDIEREKCTTPRIVQFLAAPGKQHPQAGMLAQRMCDMFYYHQIGDEDSVTDEHLIDLINMLDGTQPIRSFVVAYVAPISWNYCTRGYNDHRELMDELRLRAIRVLLTEEDHPLKGTKGKKGKGKGKKGKGKKGKGTKKPTIRELAEDVLCSMSHFLIVRAIEGLSVEDDLAALNAAIGTDDRPLTPLNDLWHPLPKVILPVKAEDVIPHECAIRLRDELVDLNN